MAEKMNKKDLEYFRKLMESKREKLLQELGYMKEASLGKSTKEMSGDLSGYSFHMADQAADSMEQENMIRLAEREGDFFHHLNEALYRIKEGTYGICKACNKLISKERLKAVPHTTMCIKCKEADQKRR